jgi:hypothetical protein
MAEDETTALDLCRALGEFFHMRFGVLTIDFAGGDPVLVREGRTYKADQLALLTLPQAEPGVQSA